MLTFTAVRLRFDRGTIVTVDSHLGLDLAKAAGFQWDPRVQREHLIMPITCDVGRKERDIVLERFRSGALRALVSARVLNEGLDVPDADLAIIVGSSLGEREHVQRVGRLLRPAPGKRALVYELVARRTTEVGQARRRRAALGP